MDYLKFSPAVVVIAILLFHTSCNDKPNAISSDATSSAKVSLWLTNPDKSSLFEEQDIELIFSDTTNSFPTIEIDTSKTFQTIEGFGYTLTGGSAIVINQLKQNQRTALLRELFGTEGNNIGVSYLRLSIGASDLSDRVFSYNDLSAGETDPDMEKFTLEPDRKDLIPLLREILAINPEIQILGSPWSPPTWMKTNNSSIGGSLKRDFYDAYAKYFVKYIQEMQAEGIKIDAITVQNEPLHPGNNPSLLMPASDQADFIKKSLGPAFEKASIDTKIIIYDHNADRIDYPLEILNDPEAAKYVDGTAFHLYGGKIEDLAKLHQAYPEKHLYFTEQWVGAPANFGEDLKWHVKNLIIGATRNWCKTVLEWNLAADSNQDPHTEGGCDRCLGAITVGDKEVTRNVAYYIIAHASKFVTPGSTRVASNISEGLPNVAFSTPDGKKVIIALNEGQSDKSFNIRFKGTIITSTLKAGAVGTYVW